MAAGLGFKTFTTGEVLTSADTNGYLMQGVLVFADAAARTAAITSPQEGQMSYLKDTNSVESYSGAAWVAVGSSTPINPNLVINGNFTINQRAYVSADNLASGAYGFDRWKSNFTNTTLTFTSAPAGQEVTINSGGGLQQVVEQANVPAGTYTLSFSGTATGRIYNSGATPPSYAASPISFTADGLANVVVEFTATGSTKTLSKVKLESGSSATAYCYAGGTIEGELSACQRYFWQQSTTTNNAYAVGACANSTDHYFFGNYPVTFRVAPTATYTTASSFQVTAPGVVDVTVSSILATYAGTTSFQTVASTASNANFAQGRVVNINNASASNIKWSAEL
jgi:hypothetical protein